jgi:hypothetical protein
MREHGLRGACLFRCSCSGQLRLHARYTAVFAANLWSEFQFVQLGTRVVTANTNNPSDLIRRIRSRVHSHLHGIPRVEDVRP